MARKLPYEGLKLQYKTETLLEIIQMIWMEFIKVQTARSNVAAKLKDFVLECKQCKGLLDAKVFVHAVVEDCSLCLLWKTDKAEPSGSSIGLHLSNTLKKYGLVDHSVWVEREEIEEKVS